MCSRPPIGEGNRLRRRIAQSGSRVVCPVRQIQVVKTQPSRPQWMQENGLRPRIRLFHRSGFLHGVPCAFLPRESHPVIIRTPTCLPETSYAIFRLSYKNVLHGISNSEWPVSFPHRKMNPICGTRPIWQKRHTFYFHTAIKCCFVSRLQHSFVKIS